MADKFDKILDECADRVTLKGETVEDCVARYPEHAAQLRRYLPIVVRASRTCAFTSSKASKDLGRQKLQTEFRALQRVDAQREARRGPWRSMVSGWQPRWVVAVAALILAIVTGSASTAAASVSALPGDSLYPVKLATEETRLALQFSETGKARLHLAYAERRAEEMSSLLKTGNTSRLEATQKRLLDNLATSARITSDLKDARDMALLMSELGWTSSQALAYLQVALQTASQESSLVAFDIFLSSSEAYSDVFEALAVRARRTTQPPVATATGTLQLRVSGPPPLGVGQLLIEVVSIETHLAASQESHWVSIEAQPQTFDLLRTAEVQRFLGEQEVEPGIYTKVRFEIIGATVVTDAGVAIQARVPSGFVSLARPFRVEEGKTTVVLLDFHGAQSLQVIGQQEYIMAPRAIVLVREPDERTNRPGKEAERRQEQSRDEGRGEERPDNPQRTEPAETRMELEGSIEALSSNLLTVRGKRIVIDSDTVIRGAAEVGKRVEVRVMSRPDGTLVAVRIEVMEERQRIDKDGGSDGKRPPETPSSEDKRKSPDTRSD
jgi:hypothetical protein